MMKKFLLLLNLFFLILLSGCVTFNFSFSQESSPAETIGYAVGSDILEDYSYPELVNTISLQTMKANVTVYTTSYTNAKVFGSTQFGSGVLFHYDEPFYYLLTNHHVIDFEDDHEKRQFEIEDFQGNVYDAHLYRNSAIESLDLAILYFPKGEIDLHVISLAPKNPQAESQVIAIGQPEFQKNAITFGTVKHYETISIDDGAELSFESIVHDATIKPGSSGGMLINTNLDLVGLNFAYSESDEEVEYYAIPVETITEFLLGYTHNE